MFTALLLIDLQTDFLSEGGRLPVGSADAQRVISAANRLIALHERRRWPLLLSCSQYKKYTIIGNYLRRYAAMEGSGGGVVDPRIQASNPVIFPKPDVSAFSNPYLVEYLKEKLVDRVVICGVHAEGSVRATALDARRARLDVILISDGVASARVSKLPETLSRMRERGVRILSLQEYLTSATAPPPG